MTEKRESKRPERYTDIEWSGKGKQTAKNLKPEYEDESSVPSDVEDEDYDEETDGSNSDLDAEEWRERPLTLKQRAKGRGGPSDADDTGRR